MGAEASMSKEGNCRLVSIGVQGYPSDPWDLATRVALALAEQEMTPAGPLWLLFSRPPQVDEGPSDWPCQAGYPVIGMPRPTGRLLVDDFSRLVASSLPHLGRIVDLAATYRRLADQAAGSGLRLRPYWRLRLGRKRLGEHDYLPESLVSVFVDR